MKRTLKPSTLGAFLTLLLLCSCATTREPASELPADVNIASDAGRGNWLFVTIRLESGEELPFVVDTGSSWTLLDRSLEPKLGKRHGTMTVPTFGQKKQLNRYVAPKLYLGSTRLMTCNHIYTTDHLKAVSSLSRRHVMGLLGMDCLKHYCIQMDFAAGKMRFLDPQHVNAAELGKAIPVAFKYLPFIRHASVVEGKGTNWWLIDTGCDIDGLLGTALFPSEGRENSDVSISRNQAAPGQGSNVHESMWFPKAVWNGDTYTNLVIGNGADLIGLRFLARHLVTFDFPKRTMYLKQTSIGPLEGDSWVEKVAGAITSSTQFLESLKEKGQLPGWSKGHDGQLFCMYHAQGDTNSYTFVFRENSDSSICPYHYRVTRESEGGPWKLHSAWRTDQNGRTIKEYPGP